MYYFSNKSFDDLKDFEDYRCSCGRVNSHPDMSLVFRGKSNDNLYIGCELETENEDKYELDSFLQENKQPHFYGCNDGSLKNYGLELVSDPMTPKMWEKENIEEMFELLKENGFTSEKGGRCGLHFHYSKDFFGDDEFTQINNIAKILYFFKHFENNAIAISGRKTFDYVETNFCSCSKESCFDFAQEEFFSSSRYAIRFCPHTFEIRLMRGTLNAKVFRARFDFCLNLVKNCKKILWSDVENWDKWLKGCKPETIEYINKRLGQ